MDALVTLVSLAVVLLLAALSIVNIVPDRWLPGLMLATLAVVAGTLGRVIAKGDDIGRSVKRLERSTGAEVARLTVSTSEAIGRMEQRLDASASIRVLTGAAINRVLAEARRDTDEWIFRGATGTFVRETTLPECIEHARPARRRLSFTLEILDPRSEDACQRYIALHQGLAENGHSAVWKWTVKGTLQELYATILAACWHQRRYEPLEIQIGLSTVHSTLRWELSKHCLIVTTRGPGFPAMQIAANDPLYDVWGAELQASFKQSRRVPLDQARDLPLGGPGGRLRPTVEEVRQLLAGLQLTLPAGFEDGDVSTIVEMALKRRDPSDPASMGA